MQNARISVVGLIVRGFLAVLPVLLLVILFQQVFVAVEAIFNPLLDALPGTVFRRTQVRFLAVLAALAALLLLVGLLGKSRPGRATGSWLEDRVLNHLPFYTFLRSVAASLTGRDDAIALAPVVVTVDAPGLRQLGFIIERHANGDATVFLPASPTAGTGTVVIVDAPRIEMLPVPPRRVLACLTHWGHGTAAALATLRTTSLGSTDVG